MTYGHAGGIQCCVFEGWLQSLSACMFRSACVLRMEALSGVSVLSWVCLCVLQASSGQDAEHRRSGVLRIASFC